MEPVKEPKIYRDPERTKILWIGILVALAVLAAIALATMSLNRTMKSTGAFTGKIIAKEFTPEPAQEITVGQGGLQSTRAELREDLAWVREWANQGRADSPRSPTSTAP